MGGKKGHARLVVWRAPAEKKHAGCKRKPIAIGRPPLRPPLCVAWDVYGEAHHSVESSSTSTSSHLRGGRPMPLRGFGADAGKSRRVGGAAPLQHPSDKAGGARCAHKMNTYGPALQRRLVRVRPTHYGPLSCTAGRWLCAHSTKFPFAKAHPHWPCTRHDRRTPPPALLSTNAKPRTNANATDNEPAIRRSTAAV